MIDHDTHQADEASERHGSQDRYLEEVARRNREKDEAELSDFPGPAEAMRIFNNLRETWGPILN